MPEVKVSGHRLQLTWRMIVGSLFPWANLSSRRHNKDNVPGQPSSAWRLAVELNAPDRLACNC